MAKRDIVVIGASAGGVEALMRLVATLPSDLDAAICVVLHIPREGPSALPQVLSRAGPLRAVVAKDGAPLRPGVIYVAPPDRHLLLQPGRVHLAAGPRENGHRPAVDALFRSAAREYATRVIGVILSGTLDDGTGGLVAVKMRGGLAVVQSPDDALYSGMCVSAIEHVRVDHVLPVAEIGALLTRLVREEAPPAPETSHAQTATLEMETDIDDLDPEALGMGQPTGKPSPFACPDCHGVLWEANDGDLLRFRCRVGHAYNPASLHARQGEALDEALWTAYRALKEKAALARRLAARALKKSLRIEELEEQAREAETQAETVRSVISRGPPGGPSRAETKGGGGPSGLS